MDQNTINVDIAILGGGIAGLWALNRVRKLGYKAILLEKNSLGAGQTIRSQGIIHGGIKFALSGFLTGSANAVETMPNRWKKSLEGQGEIDCRTVKILSNDQLLWSTGSLGSEVTSFFASKTLSSRVKKLDRSNYPLVLQNPAFKGHIYRLEEVVLDMPSLIKTLAEPHMETIFKINEDQGYEFIRDPNNPQNVLALKLGSGQETLNIKAQRYLLTAGEGNEALTQGFAKAPEMQRRPLQMVMLKLSRSYPLFAHCIDHGVNPRITITTHPTQEGKSVWYLGGQLAEEGAKRTESEQINAAKKEIQALFPWLDITNAEWASFFVNRAEPKQPGGKRPETVFIETLNNVMIAWPTKLALSPLLSDQIIHTLEQQKIYPSAKADPNMNLALPHLKKPPIAVPPWDELFPSIK